MFNKKKIASAIALSAIGASALTVAPVVTAEGITLEEIVVTARKRSENLQEVPVAVSALTGEDLAIRGTGNIAELADEVPSVTLEASRATSSTLTAFIRGIGQQDPLAGFEQGVGIYLDDVYLARPQGAMLDVYEVERVEVLRGPQGTLYGRNTVGGAIKYITKGLSDEPTATVKATLGSYNQQDLVVGGSMPVTDTFKLGATVASLTRDGYGRNLTTGEEHYNKDLLAFRVSAEFAPTEDILIKLSYDYSEDDSNPVSGHRIYDAAVSDAPVLSDEYNTRAGASENASTASIGGRNNIEAEGAMLSVEWTINDEMTFKSVTAAREDYTESVIDFDSLPVADMDAPVIYDNEQFSQEFQLLYSGDTINGVLGLYWLDANAANDFDVVLFNSLTAYTGGDVDTESWSVFGDVTFAITDQLDISVGARYTSDERTADVQRDLWLGVGSPAFGNDAAIFIRSQGAFIGNETYTNFSPRLNVSYQLNDDVNIYAGYSQGWKAGGFDPRGDNTAFPNVEEGYDEELLTSYELGIKSDLLDGRARVNIALFHSLYEDMQVPSSVGVDSDDDGINDSFAGLVTNAGEAEISGIEFEGDLAITENLKASLAFSVLDAGIEEWILDGADISDQRVVQNTPEKMGNLTLRHTADAFGGRVISSLSLNHKGASSQFEAPFDLIDQDSYNTVNASFVWLDDEGHWTVGLHGKNLGNELIKTSGYCFGTGCATVLGAEDNVSVFLAPPRTLSATVEYSF